MLPDINGFEILLRLRAAKIKTPILILSSLTDTYQKITGFSSGADDYLTKPLVREDLFARNKAINIRSKGHAASVFRFDKVSVNLDTRSVEVDSKKVHLMNKEYAILELVRWYAILELVRRATIVTKEMILNPLYSSVDEPEIKIIDVFFCKLRKKL